LHIEKTFPVNKVTPLSPFPLPLGRTEPNRDYPSHISGQLALKRTSPPLFWDKEKYVVSCPLFSSKLLGPLPVCPNPNSEVRFFRGSIPTNGKGSTLPFPCFSPKVVAARHANLIVPVPSFPFSFPNHNEGIARPFFFLICHRGFKIRLLSSSLPPGFSPFSFLPHRGWGVFTLLFPIVFRIMWSLFACLSKPPFPPSFEPICFSRTARDCASLPFPPPPPFSRFPSLNCWGAFYLQAGKVPFFSPFRFPRLCIIPPTLFFPLFLPLFFTHYWSNRVLDTSLSSPLTLCPFPQ